MNATLSLVPESWLTRLGGIDASGWLAAFRSDAPKVVADLLWNRFYFGPLNLTERGHLLSGWLEALGDSEEFAPLLDARLRDWVEANWGRFEQSGITLASAWTCLERVVALSARLEAPARLSNTAQALRARFTHREQFLGSFSTAPAADPLGLYLAVIAEFQNDRSLAGFWHRLCGLPDGVPFYHAPYALLGLRRLKAADAWESGTLRAEVVMGVLRLATAFDRLVRERGLAEFVAKSTFGRIARQLAAAYPGSPRWSEHGLAALLEMPERPRQCVLDAIRPLADAVAREKANAKRGYAPPPHASKPDPAWPSRARELAESLRHGSPGRLPEIQRLLDEQRRYTEATGDTYSIVRSLCTFASRVLKLQPALAEQWAHEALDWEPHNPFTWSVAKDVFLRQDKLDRALRIAWVAWKRFPENVVVRTGLAEVLKADGRLTEAEATYRQTIERFPENVVARNGLAEVLKAAGHLKEAEEIYRQTIERFPENVVARNGLAEAFKAAGHLKEAEEMYRQTVERFCEDVVARNGLADTLRRAERWDEAEEAYRETLGAGYGDSATLIGVAYLLLRKGEAGRTEALSLAEEALAREPHDPYALSLKQRLEHAETTDLAAIANECPDLADALTRASGASAPASDTEPEAPCGDVDTGEPPSDLAQITGSPPDWRSVVLPEPETVPVPQAISTVRLELSALLAEAGFYRVWALRGPPGAAAQCYETAASLLAKAKRLAPQDPEVQAEKLALEAVRDGASAMSDQLEDELAKHTSSLRLLLLKARLDRRNAREAQRRLSDEALAELLQAPRRLRDLNLALTPVFHFQRGLVALALLDGASRVQTAGEAFTHFRHTVLHRANEERLDRESSRDPRAREVPGFHEWLQRTTAERLFRGFAAPESVDPREVPTLEQTLASNPLLFEEIEDVAIDRIAFTSV